MVKRMEVDPLMSDAMARKTNAERATKYDALLKGVKKGWSSFGDADARRK
jgi:hypothetical protein